MDRKPGIRQQVVLDAMQDGCGLVSTAYPNGIMSVKLVNPGGERFVAADVLRSLFAGGWIDVDSKNTTDKGVTMIGWRLTKAA